MQPTENLNEEGRPWYAQFWGWFVFTPLFVVILVGTALVIVAFSQSDDRVVDDYYKQGKLINHRFQAEKNASLLGVSGTLSFNLMENQVAFELNKWVDSPGVIQLYLSHPAYEEKDQYIELKYVSSNQFVGVLDSAIRGRWYIKLSSVSSVEGNETELPWRISAEINLDHNQEIQL